MKKRKEGRGYQIGGWFGLVVLDKIGDRYNSGIRARSIELNGGNEAKLVSGSKEGSECVERHGEAAIRTVMMERKRPSQLWYGERHWDLCVNEKREKERKRLVILIEKGRRKQERERNEGDMGNNIINNRDNGGTTLEINSIEIKMDHPLRLHIPLHPTNYTLYK